MEGADVVGSLGDESREPPLGKKAGAGAPRAAMATAAADTRAKQTLAHDSVVEVGMDSNAAMRQRQVDEVDGSSFFQIQSRLLQQASAGQREAKAGIAGLLLSVSINYVCLLRWQIVIQCRFRGELTKSFVRSSLGTGLVLRCRPHTFNSDANQSMSAA